MSFDREKFLKVLAMFGSDHDGEVAAAARLARKMLLDTGLDWETVIVAERPATPAGLGQAYREASPGTATYATTRPPGPNFWGAETDPLDEIRRRQEARDRAYSEMHEEGAEEEGWVHHDDRGSWREGDPRVWGWDKVRPSGEAHLDPETEDVDLMSWTLEQEGKTRAQAERFESFARTDYAVARWLFAQRHANPFWGTMLEWVLVTGKLQPWHRRAIERLMKRSNP